MPGIGSRACPKWTPDQPTFAEELREKRAEKATHRRQVYALVDKRDGTSCRVCEAFCKPSSPDTLTRADRHHIIPRSLGGEDSTQNLLTLCRACHDERHVKGTLALSGNADERDGTGRLIGIRVERLRESGWTVEKLC